MKRFQKSIQRSFKTWENPSRSSRCFSLDKTTQTCEACITLNKNIPSYVLRLRQMSVKKLPFLRTFRSWKTNWKIFKRIWRSLMNFTIIKRKKDMIFGKSVHKQTKIMMNSKWVNIIFGWSVKNTRNLWVFLTMSFWSIKNLKRLSSRCCKTPWRNKNLKDYIIQVCQWNKQS